MMEQILSSVCEGSWSVHFTPVSFSRIYFHVIYSHFIKTHISKAVILLSVRPTTLDKSPRT